MQRNSTRFFIYSILVMAILVIVASSLVLNFTTQFQNSEDVNIANAASANQFSAGLVSSGDGIIDGAVPADYEHSSGTPISTASGLYSYLKNASNGSYGYLTTSITLDSNYVPYTASSSGARAEDISFASGATLDGCGNTIIMSGQSTTTANSSQFFGGLMHNCAGTIKNLRIETSAYLRYGNTNEINVDMGAGLVVGKLTGTISNCYIKWEGNTAFWNKKTSGTYDLMLGGVCASNEGGTIKNTTVELATELTLQSAGYTGIYVNKNWDMWLGGFAGKNNSSSSKFIDITITGSGALKNYQVNGGGGYSDTGAIVGWATGANGCTINGVKIAGSFNVTSSTNNENHRGLIVGGADKTVNVSNVYYSTQNNNWYSRFNAGNTYTIGTDSAGINTLYSYAIDDSSFGFCHSDDTKIWIGEPSDYSGLAKTTTGNYVSSVTIGTALDVSALASTGLSNPYIPTIAKANVDGNISGYTLGKYAYIANEATNIRLTYNNATPTVSNLVPTSNSATTTYNGYTATPVVTEQIYRGNEKETTIDLESWTYTGSIKEVGSYSLSKTYNSTAWSSGSYYLISVGSFSANVTITKNTTQNISISSTIAAGLKYNASAQTGLTINQSCASDFISGSGDASTEEITGIVIDQPAGTTRAYSGAINSGTYQATSSATNAGSYTISYTISFKNYADKAGTFTYTIAKFTRADSANITFASTMFQNGSDAAGTGLNYSYTSPAATGTMSKIYDAKTISYPAVNNANLKIYYASGDNYTTFDSVSSLTIKDVVVDGGGNVTNYALVYTKNTDSNITGFTVTFNITINKATITPDVEDSTFEYNGLAQSAAPEVPQDVAGDVELTYYSGTSLNHSASPIDKASVIDVGAYCIYISTDGNLSSNNYQIEAGWINFYIYPKTLTMTLVKKEYDGTTAAKYINATNNTFTGFIGSETSANLGFTANETIGSYDSKNIQTAGSITLSASVFTSLSLADNTGAITTFNRIKNSNYCMASTTPSANVGYIYPATLTYSATKVYDANATINASNVTFNGFVNGETSSTITGFSGNVGSFNNATVGNNKTITLNAGFTSWDNGAYYIVGTSSNYTICAPGASSTSGAYGSITKATLTDTSTGYTGTYDAVAHGITVSVSGFVGGQTLGSTGTIKYGTTSGSYTLNSNPTYANVADSKTIYYQITFTNYNTITGSKDITISRKTLTDTSTGYSGMYDAAAHGITVSASGFAGSETIGSTGTIMYGTTSGSYTLDTNPTYANVADSKTIYYQVTFANYNTITGSKSISISRRTLRVLFNDTKDLYDSILDTTGNYYDFIYVVGSDYTLAHINAFISDYAKYFTKVALYGTTPADSTYTLTTWDDDDYIKISVGASTSSVAGTDYYLTYTWGSKATSEMKNNYTIGSGADGTVIIATTGAGYAEQSTYCDPARNASASSWTGYKIRVRVVANRSYNYSTGTIDALATFINGHYYDADYAGYTTCTVTSQITYNRPIDGSRIMASYKVLNGNNNTFNIQLSKNNISKNNSMNLTVVSEIGGKSNSYTIDANHETNASAIETNFNGTYNTQYPAYTQIDGTTYYGAAILVALNYGQIKGFNINYTMADDEGSITNERYTFMRVKYLSHKDHNTAMGQICGINLGIVNNNSINANRLIRFESQASGYEFVVGQMSGINNGEMYSNSISTTTRVTDKKNGDSTHNWHINMQVLGTASKIYFGTICGLNSENGSLYSMSYSTTTPLYIDVTATLYAGGLVGKNEGSISNLTLNNVQTTEDYSHEIYWTSSFGSGTAGEEFAVRGHELYFSTNRDNYSGGICGWNEGTIVNSNYQSSANAPFKALLNTAGYTAVVGGIAGVNGGTVSYSNSTIAGSMVSGYESTGVAFNAYAATGGIVGVNSLLLANQVNGGSITNCTTIINATGRINASRGTGSYSVFTGGLLGVGCEEGTYNAQNRVTFAGYNIAPGILRHSSMFNYGRDGNNNWSYSIGANYGAWGYLTGYYNSILPNNYTHEYGSLIWYTQYDTPRTLDPLAYYTKSIFGSIATILGYNGGLSSTSVNITGIAGIGIRDCGDGTLAASLLNGVTLDVPNSLVIISYNNFTSQATSGGYTGWDCTINGVMATITTASQTNVTKATTFTEGTIKTASTNVNAVITDTTVEASVAYFTIRPYVNITCNADYLNYLSTSYGTNSQGKDAALYYCAGYATITAWSDGTMTGDPWNGSMSEYKTIDGNGITITYAPSANTSNGDSRWPNEANGMYSRYSSTSSSTAQFFGASNFLGVNNGTIKNLNLVMNVSGTKLILGNSARNYVYGILTAINAGTIENCKVTITGGGIIGLAGSTSGQMYAVGAISAISFGSISKSTVIFENNTTLAIYGDSSSYRYDTTKKGYLGGVAGLVSGGIIEDCVVLGKGNIKAMNTLDGFADRNLGAYVGGIAGMMLFNNTSSTQVLSATIGTVNSTSAKNFVVALVGEISSAATGTLGGAGYITGAAFAGTSTNNIDTYLTTHDFGTMLVIGYGIPSIVSNVAPSMQNTIFGATTYLPTNNDYSDLSSLTVVLFEDYSERGLGATSFVSSISIIIKRASVSTFLKHGGSAFEMTGVHVTCQETTAGLSSTLTLQNTANIIQAETSATDGVTTRAYASIQSRFDTTNAMIKYIFAYSVDIAGESINYDSVAANSPFMNFISGRGNQYLYAGAKVGRLVGSISLDKINSAAVIFKEGKVLDGNGYNFSYRFGGSSATQVRGISDASGNEAVGSGNISNIQEYPYSYNYDGTTYYGISDLISINYGTIQNLNVRVVDATNEFVGLNANVAFGVLCGINVGTIQNCTVYANQAITYRIAGFNKQTVLALGVGINVGVISNLDVEYRDNTYTVMDTIDSTSSNYNANIVFGLGVGINGYNYSNGGARGQITGLKVTNSGVVRVGSASQLETEKSRKINSVTMAGLVAINAGGELHYSTILGTGAFIVNSQYDVSGVFIGYNSVTEMSEEDFNSAQSSNLLYTRSGTEGNYTYTEYTGTYADMPTPIYFKNYATVARNVIDINYLHFAIGVALTNNETFDINRHTYETGVNVYPSLVGGINKLDYMLIDFSGSVQYYAANYMAGLAFAKATDHTHITNTDVAYKGIVWNELFNSDMELFTAYDGYAAGANMTAAVQAAGLAVMGWIPTLGIGDDANFVGGAQVKANVGSLTLEWNPAYNGKLIMRTPETTMKDKNPFKAFTTTYLPSGTVKQNIVNNASCYVFDKSELYATIEFNISYLMTSRYIVNESGDARYKGNAMRINIEFNYPYVEINDVYQLVQFMWFNASDSENMVNYYLRTYLSEVKKLIDVGLKKAEAVNPYGAWADMEDPDIDLILSHFAEGEYFICYYDDNYYYIFIEKYYDADGDEITYYSANEGRLGDDILLDRYGNANPNFGFNLTSSFEFPQNKVLDGQEHGIQLIATQYDTRTYNSLVSTSKWYNSENGNVLPEVTLSDNRDTPSYDQSSFIFGGFVGINRGTIKNINFTFRENSVLNIANEDLSAKEYRRHLYVGLISAYSTGVIDNCTLELEAHTQVFVNKYLPSLDGNFFDPRSDKDYYGGVFMGGFAGLLGKNAVISNCTVNFGDNTRFGANNVGNNGIGAGHIYTFVGGFTGMMLGGSSIYNAKIEGSETSRLFAVIDSTNYTRVVNAAGGLVGVNSTYYLWNQWGLGSGKIDGVIYNWQGRTISAYWNGGLKLWGWEPNLGGDRAAVKVYTLGGNVAGVIGESINDNWATTTNDIDNLYYTFDLDKYDLSKINPKTGQPMYTAERALTLYKGTSYNASNTVNKSIQNADKNEFILSANVSVSDAINSKQTLNELIKVLAVWELAYNSAGVSNTGITITGGSSDVRNNGKVVVTTGYSAVNASSSYKKLETIGKVLMWQDKTIGSNILCSFTVGQDNPSAIVWQITIDDAVSDTGSNLADPEGTAVTEIPVYKFAQSLEEAQEYKKMNYSILRGQGHGMNLYYCLGDSAVLSPNRVNYTNEVTDDERVYYPKKALMYDGSTSATNSAVSVYDSKGTVITRITDSDVANIINSAGSNFSRTVYVKNAQGNYVLKGENEDVTKVGSYKVVFTIKTNGLNNNAYVDSNHRVMFFGMDGEEATISYNSNLYVRRTVGVNQYYYQKVVDEELIEHLQNVTPSNGVYVWEDVSYMKKNNSFYLNNRITDASTIAALTELSGEVETYTIYMVIAPISIKLTKITKLYDGSTQFNYTGESKTNYTSFEATVQQTFTYAAKANPTVSMSDTTHKLTLVGSGSGQLSGTAISPSGSYDSPEVGNRTATFNIQQTPLTYTLYEYNADEEFWYTSTITTYYLQDANNATTFFTIDALTTLQEINDTLHTKRYGYDTNILTQYSITNSDACVVKIYKAKAPTIAFDEVIKLKYDYIGADIDYVTESNLLHHILITTDLGDTWRADDTTYFKPGEFTITQNTTGIQDVEENGHQATVTVTYIGAQFPTGASQTLSLTVYVAPAQLTVVRAVKDYDGNNSLVSSGVVMTGFKNDDTKGVITGTYSQSDVGRNLGVTITGTTPVSFTIGTQTYTYNTLFTNYYIASGVQNVGYIAPIAAKIVNAYKTFDGTNAVSYGSLDTNTKILIKAGENGTGTKLDFEPAGTYSTEQVGACKFITTLEPFTFPNVDGVMQTRYRIKDGNNATNYYIVGGQTRYQASGATILPREIVITNVYKEYDGTTTLGTFNIASGLVQNDSTNSFDGSYKTANVVFANNKYNDVLLNGASVSFITNNGTATQNVTYIVLKKGGSNSNYFIKANENDVTLAGTTYTISGRGVIIPGEIQVTSVVKYYDNKSTFDTSKKNITGSFRFNSEVISNVSFTGKMYANGQERIDAIDQCDVKLDVGTFAFNGNYNWLEGTNYRVGGVGAANPTFAGVGQILQLTIKVDGQTSSGSIKNVYFSTPSGNVSVKSDHYTSMSASTFETEYKKGQQYSTSNFCGSIVIDSVSYNIVNGVCSDLGLTLSLGQTVAENAGLYTFVVSMEDSTNYVLDANNKSFYFNIDRKTLLASQIELVMADVTKEYNNSTTTPTPSVATAARAVIEGEQDPITLTGSYGNSSMTANNCKNAGTYSQGSGVNEFVLTQTNISVRSTNYKYMGSLTSTTAKGIYNSTNYAYETKYIITKATLSGFPTEFTKDFDGTSTFTYQLQGVSESINATFTNSDILWPGVYEDLSMTVSHEGMLNYEGVANKQIDLTINKAKVVLERGFKTTTASINYFNVVFAITDVLNFNFLSVANPNLTEQLLANIVSDGIDAEDSALEEFVNALNSLFVLKINDAAVATLIDLDMLDAINVIEENETYKALEITLKGEKTLDIVTLTDRYEIYMKGAELDENVYVLTPALKGSNVARSSSELADGQFTGAYVNNLSTAISSLQDLIDFVSDGTNVSGYLTRNIYGYDAVLAQAKPFIGTLDGNGYTIEIVGGFAEDGTYQGAFVPKSSGTIKNVNFKYVSNAQIDAQGKVVGLVVGQNTGAIENVSLDILSDVSIKDATTPTIGGLAGTIGAGSIVSHVTITYSESITYAGFVGLANTITGGMVSYVTVKNNPSCEDLETGIYALANTSNIQINYVINGTNIQGIDLVSNAKLQDGTTDTLVNVYGNSTTQLALFNNGYANGYLDYYFATKGKFTTNNSLHNEYDSQAQTNINTSYYYGYNQSEVGYYLAIEVIAPINRFVWEGMDAYYTTYGTSLNRVVGLYALSNVALDTPQELVSAAPTSFNTTGASKFHPVIGVIASTVISSGTSTVQEYEYTGSQIKAAFNATSSEIDQETGLPKEITLYISGTNVGTYTEYYQEIDHQESVEGITWDVENFIAQILTSESGVGEQSIMLIITPKELVDAPTLSKEYDSTNIAERQFDVNSDGTTDIYAVGEYNNTNVGTGYEIKYYSTTKTVAAYESAGVYTFVTYYLSGYDDVASKHIYTVKYIYVNNNPFTSNVNVSSLSTAQFASAYNQLVTLKEIQDLVNNENNLIIYSNNIGDISNLKSVNVYDLTFTKTVDENSKITGYSAVNYSTTIYNVNGTRAKNYTYKPTANAFSAASIVAPNNSLEYREVELSSNTYVANTYYVENNSSYVLATGAFDANETYYEAYELNKYVVVESTGVITKRTIPATYSNLNQSYRGQLAPIGIQIASIENLDNLPYSLTNAQKTSLISALNTELNAGTTFSGNVLESTYEDNSNPDHTKLTRQGSEGNYTYSATTQEFQTIQLSAIDGTYDVSANLRVSFNEGATLTLRYFEYDNVSTKYVIDTFDALMMVDAKEYRVVELDENTYRANAYYTRDNNTYTLAIGEYDSEATYYAVSDYQDLHYIVTNNLNGKGRLVEMFENTFNGTIEGQGNDGKIIRNFTLVGNSATGLFSQLSATSIISKLTFVNVLAVAIQNNATIGIVSQTNNGTISNVNVDAVVAADGTVSLKPLGGGTISSSLAIIETTKDLEVDTAVASQERLSTVILYRVYGLNGSAAIRLANANEETKAAITASVKAVIKTNRINSPIAISEDIVQIANFREYWAWVNLFKEIFTGSNTTTFIGHEFIL